VTGPEHHAAGEALLEDAAKYALTTVQRRTLVAEAHAHFAAAQVAATVEVAMSHGPARSPWLEVLS
jgi:hypothetical protein